MARYVKCYYCGQRFDRDKIEAVPIEGKRRYAHRSCHERISAISTQDEQDRLELETYIKDLFDYKELPQIVNKQINQFLTENNYTYSGMLKSLKYFYEIKHGDKEKAYGRIGIIPFVYADAFNYYYALWETQQRNAESIQMTEVLLPTVEILIDPPQRKVMGKRKNTFSFLDIESEDDK